MPLRTRLIACDALSLTTVGLRARAPGAAAHVDAVRAIVERACARGVNWVESPPGDDTGRLALGATLVGFAPADRPLVAVGLGALDETRATTTWDGASIGHQVDAALRDLGVEVLDLAFLWVPTGGPVEALWHEVSELVVRGKVRCAGLAGADTEVAERCHAIAPVAAVQTAFSMIHRGPALALLRWCVEREVALLASSPMELGLLSGAFSPERAASLEPTDCRAHSAEFRPPHLARNLSLVDALDEVAARHHTSPAAIAVAWTLAWPGVVAALVGARTPEQVDAWTDAAAIDLDGTDLDDIAAAIVASGAGSGPTRPTRTWSAAN